MRKVAILFSLILIVFLAGCVGRTTVTGGQGVVITSFSPDSPTVDTNVPVTFTLVLENKGERTATGLIAKLFGLSSDWDKTSMDYTFPLKTGETSPSLAGADPTMNIPGETVSSDVNFTPTAKKAVDTTYQPEVRVAYSYSTISESLLKVATAEYIRSVKTGEKIPTLGIISSKTTAGPLTVNVKTRTTTIPPGAVSTTVTFEIQNVGGGRVFSGTPSITPSAEVLDNLNYEIKSGDKTPCSGPGRLVGGKSKVITCQITLPTGFVNFVEVPVKLELKYNYFVDSSASVTVLKWLGEIPADTGTTGVTGVTLTVPTLVSPIGGSTVSSLTPTLDWSDATGATCYKVYVKKPDGSFAVDGVKSTTSSFPIPTGNLVANTIYNWLVSAHKNSDCSDTPGVSSGWETFKTP